MGSSLDSFNVMLSFDRQGEVSLVKYWDREGCGARATVELGDTIESLVKHHLEHYRKSHRQAPTRYCSFSIPHPNPKLVDMEYYCVLDSHLGEDHELRARKRR